MHPRKAAYPGTVCGNAGSGYAELCRRVEKDLGRPWPDRAGAGAAGGLGAGCVAFLGAELVSGAELVMEYSCGAVRRRSEADIIIGER